MSEAHPVQHLYIAHHQWLRDWLIKKTQNTAFAEDIVQDVFVALIEKPQQVLQIDEHRAFLLTIAKRKLFNSWRRKNLEQAYLESLHSIGIAQQDIPAEQLCLIQDVLYQIQVLLGALPINVQQAFLLNKIEKFTHPEIAKLMNISLASVERYIKQATIHCILQRKSMSNES